MNLMAILTLMAGMAGAAVAAENNTASSVPLPNGEVGHAVACSGEDEGWAACYRAASDACGGKPYAVVERESRSGFFSSGRWDAEANRMVYDSQGSSRREMIVRCLTGTGAE